MRNAFVLLALLAVIALVPSMARAACITAACHPQLDQQAYPHAPVADDCLSCHVVVTPTHPQAGQKTFKLVAEGAELCFQCHEQFGNNKAIHDPVKGGECTACHQVHGAANPKLLEVGDDLSALCFGCHDEAPFKGDFRHGPAAAGACTSCHDPHVAGEKSLLKKPVRTVCLECHSEFEKQLQTAPVIHDPVKQAPCIDCHDPHASSSRFVLKQKMPDLCFDCHEKISEQLARIKVKHAPVTDDGSCGNCHSVHFSNVRGLLPTDEKTLCLNCHGTDNLGSPPLRNIKKQLAPKPVAASKIKKSPKGIPGKVVEQEQDAQKNLHGPLMEGKCSGCHDPHGTDYFRLLTGPYPAGLYSSYQVGAYDFCLQCHDRYMLRYKDTSIYTDFRNGNFNLHFVHVADKRKGRTCRACHETHASDGKKLINETGVSFGNWNIPIRFEKTETGGSCSPGCHRPLKYDREQPVDYRGSGS